MEHVAGFRGGRRRGFTLIEMMVVIAILGLLMALILPAVQAAREAARRSACQCNLKQLVIALHNYHSAWDAFPAGYVSGVGGGSIGDPAFGVELGGGWAWGAAVLPFLEQTPLYDAVNFQRPVNAPESRTVRSTALPVFLCPSSPRVGPASFHCPKPAPDLPTDLAASQYLANGGSRHDPAAGVDGGDGVFDRNVARRLADITDGTSNTLMLGERSRRVSDASWVGVVPDGLVPEARLCTDPAWPYQVCGGAFGMVLAYTDLPAGEPNPRIGVNSTRAGQESFWGVHRGGVFFALCDGSVRLLKDTTDPHIFSAAATRGGGEVMSCDCY
ncbi:DUF1559 domain-containing protein [Paludisphaera mucosa]|uniref:DUF1559 domain-containing protein n=1 Tax=Paludisphaera mucosa TaxID=3030827 RepID=A0ABT6FH31_9BACT|nr:DUF1559 domain-containing protein [Paludisphaera mucosa]MDG3006901.1 DUF1559 domain-containing protein [Paludisphaera mucosa]